MTTETLTLESPLTGVVRQTLAILHDAYRELNSKKMFWIVMILSGIAMAGFAVISVTPTELKLAGYDWDTGFVAPKSLYKYVFNQVIVEYWLTWAATILAIVSTAGIFPDFLSGGSVDLFISKPISRLRLFLTKYACGMLFVFLQVFVFCVIAFFVIGIRGKFWEPRVFLAIPIVMCFFSYLFAVAVLLGVLTRSTIATLLLTILFWAMAFAVYFGEVRLQAFINIGERRIGLINNDLAELAKSKPTTSKTTINAFASAADMLGVKFKRDPREIERENLITRRDRIASNLQSLRTWHRVAAPLHLLSPKTTETTDILGRSLISSDEFLSIMENKRANMPARFRNRVSDQDLLYLDDEIDDIKRSRSLTYVIGTSLVFEALVLGLAAWIFCRRDF